MNCKDIKDIQTVFQRIGIKTPDAGSYENSVYKLSGVYNYQYKKLMPVTVTHCCESHNSQISVFCSKLAAGKISKTRELVNYLNKFVRDEMFGCALYRIYPERDVVELRSGVDSGANCGDDKAGELDDVPEGSLYTENSYRIGRLLHLMVVISYCHSMLFDELMSTSNSPRKIIDQFRQLLIQEM
jgi:hypothetical protein